MKAIKLFHKTIFQISPTKPFHFDATFFKPAHFPSNDTKFQPGQVKLGSSKRWQTMLWPSFAKASEGKQEKLGLIFENKGITAKPKIRVSVFSKKKLSLKLIESLKQEIIWRYNLGLNLSEFYKEVGKDPLLKPVIKRFYGLRPMHAGSLYEYLIIAIVLQNATVRRSVSMMQTLFENYGTLLEFAGEKLWCFWKPGVLSKAKEQRLRDLKMGYRARSLIRVSQAFAFPEQNTTKNPRSWEIGNFVFDELKLRNTSSEEQEAALLSLYGIGPASVGYIIFDAFHQWDFLKHISPWEQKIYSKIFFKKDYEKNLVSVSQMLKYFEKWGKWKNLAIHYVWENIWWQRRNKHIPWLEKLVRL